MTPQAQLVERLRALLDGAPRLREVSMFGGRAFLVREKLLVSALKDGGLLVRVAEGRHAELFAGPGARQVVMGAERTMGPGWVEVSPAALATADDLASWVAPALEHNAAQASG